LYKFAFRRNLNAKSCGQAGPVALFIDPTQISPVDSFANNTISKYNWKVGNKFFNNEFFERGIVPHKSNLEATVITLGLNYGVQVSDQTFIAGNKRVGTKWTNKRIFRGTFFSGEGEALVLLIFLIPIMIFLG
jgi:hypothetical protein